MLIDQETSEPTEAPYRYHSVGNHRDGYHALVYAGHAVHWKCNHSHQTTTEAYACGRKYYPSPEPPPHHCPTCSCPAPETPEAAGKRIAEGILEAIKEALNKEIH